MEFALLCWTKLTFLLPEHSIGGYTDLHEPHLLYSDNKSVGYKATDKPHDLLTIRTVRQNQKISIPPQTQYTNSHASRKFSQTS